MTPAEGVPPDKQGYRVLAKVIFEEIEKVVDSNP